MSVKVIFISNILEDIKVEGFFSPGSLGNILNEFYLLRKADYPNLIKTKVRIEKKKPDSEDWELIPPTEWIDYKVEDNAELRIIPSYTGGGGSWGTIIGAILFVAGVAVVAYTGWTGAGAAIGKYMMFYGASLMIGTALSYTGGSPVFGAGPDLASTSATYSWEDQPNQTDPGLPVPIIYGTHRVTPHLINAYIDQTMEFIWNLQYNSSSPTTVIQTGGVNVFTTETATVQGLAFTISNPNSIYTYEVEGGSSYQDPCDFKIEYAKVGDSYTEYGTVVVPGLVNAPGYPASSGNLYIQIKDLPEGQYYIRLTNLGTSSPTSQYWSSVEEARKTTVRNEVDTQYLYMLYGVCEGQIESISDIEINGTKLDSFSEKPEYWIRLGTNHKPADNCATATIPHDPTLCNKTPIPYFNDVRNYKAQGTSGGQKLSQNVAVPMTTDGTNVGSILYHFRIPSLYKVNPSSGDMEENSVDVRMQYRLQGAPSWSTAWDVTIKSNTRSPINRYFRIPASNYLTAGQYEVQVVKLSQDSTDLKNINDIYFMGIYEIQDLNLSYPNTALLAVRIKATGQVSGGLPKISCIVKGLKILQLTAGTIANTSNNVNCLYNLFTNQRYGLGNYLETANINIEQWKTEEVYCDATVGGVTRFKLDMVIDGLAGALDLIGRICTTFRALPVYSEGAINIVIEKDTDTPAQIFNMSNILAGSLVVNYFDKTQTPNVVEAQFANEQRDYDMDFIQIRSSEAEIATVKEIKKKIALLGITRPDQIIRIGRWIYNSGIYIGRAISFKAMIDAVHCQPGDLLEFQHDVLQIGDGGRVVSATTVQVTLDKEVTIVAATSYVITGRLANDTVETKAVNEATTTGGNYPWTGTVIQMAEAFTTAPPVSSPYAFGAVDAESVTYRIVKISKDPEFNVAIDAIEYNASIYAETGFVVPHRSPTRAVDVFAPPPAVTNLTLVEATNEYGIIVSFNLPYPMDNFHKADIQLSVDGGLTYRSIVTVYDSRPYTIKDLVPGIEYYVRVISYSYRGVMCKTPAVSSIWLTGIALRPGNIYGLQIKGQGTSQYWVTRDCEFVWRWDNTYGRGETFDYFRVRILNTGGTLLREEQVKEKYYNYSFDKNKQDNGVPLSTFQIQISAVNTLGFESLKMDSMTVINSVPSSISGLTYEFSNKDCIIYWDVSTDFDVGKYRLTITGTGGVFNYYLSPDQSDFVYTYAQNVDDNGTVGDPTLSVNFYVVDAFNQESIVQTISPTNNAPGTVASLTSSPGFRSVSFYWDASIELDHKAYSIRTKVESDAWSSWFDIAERSYLRVLTTAEITANGIGATVYIEVKDKDIFDQTSASAASANADSEAIEQIDLSGEAFQLIPTDSNGNTVATLKALYDATTASGGVAYDGSVTEDWIQFEFPVSHIFNQVLIWPSASMNCYLAYSEDGVTWNYLKAEADHTLDADGKLLEATDQADAQTNYWTTGTGSLVKAVWPYMRQGRYLRLYIKSAVTIYELKFWTYVIADEIDAGVLHLARGITIASTEDNENAVLLNLNGLKLYGSNVNTVWLKNDGTFFFKSAVTGARIEFDHTALKLYDGSAQRVSLAADGTFWFGAASGTNSLSFSGGVLTLNGTLVITDGSGYANISDKPTTLSNINAGEGSKLTGIEASATVGAIWGTNLSNIPATLETPSGAGLFLSATYLGYYTGSAWTVFIKSDGTFGFKSAITGARIEYVNDALKSYDSGGVQRVNIANDGTVWFGENPSTGTKFFKFDGTDVKVGRDTQLLGADAYNNNSIFFHTFFESVDGFTTLRVTSLGGYLNFITGGLIGESSYLYKSINYSIGPQITFDKNIRFKTKVSFVHNSLQTINVGIGILELSSPWVSRHVGIQVLDNAFYGTVGNGTTETTISLATAIPGTETNYLLEAVFTTGSKAEFYIDNVKKGEITTGLPTGTGGIFLNAVALSIWPTSNSSRIMRVSEWIVLQDP